MGAWGHGLYDNDDALNELSELLATLDPHAGPVALATTVGLRVWLAAPVDERLVESVRQHSDWVAGLPAPARELLERLVSSPEDLVPPGLPPPGRRA
jgi:hypothetical protein